MKVKIEVKTAKGQAYGIVDKKKMRLFRMLLGIKLKIDKETIQVAEDGSSFIWTPEVTPKNYLKVIKNVQFFDLMITKTLNHKLVKKYLKRNLTEDQQLEVKEMLTNMTKMRIING